MKINKIIASTAIMAGTFLLPVVSKAQGYYDDDMYRDHQVLRYQHEHIGGDYDRVSRIRADIARDQQRMDWALSRGNDLLAARYSRDLARDQRALDAQLRDIHRDKQRARATRDDLNRDQYYRGDYYRDGYRDRDWR